MTQPPADPFLPDPAEPSTGPGALAIIALVMGLFSVLGAFVLGLGIVPGFIGAVVGLFAVARKDGNRIVAGIGLALSVLGVCVSGLTIYFLVWGFQQAGNVLGEVKQQQFEMAQSWEGKTVTAFELTSNEGETIAVPANDRRVTAVFLLAPFNLMELGMPVQALNDLHDGEDGTYRVVTMVPLDAQTASVSSREYGIMTPVCASQDAPDPFGIESLPGYTSAYYVLDGDGVVRAVLPYNAELTTLQEAIQSIER